MSTFFPTVRPLYKFLWLFYRLNGVWFVVMNQVEVSREKKIGETMNVRREKKMFEKKIYNLYLRRCHVFDALCPVIQSGGLTADE